MRYCSFCISQGSISGSDSSIMQLVSSLDNNRLHKRLIVKIGTVKTIIRIDYCPMCGRKLNEDETDLIDKR